MLIILTLTAGALLWSSFGNVYSTDEGCFVKDMLYFDDLTRSVNFSAFTPPSGIVFKARVKCGKGDHAVDFFSVSNNEVTMMRYNDSLTKTKECWSGPTIEAGWTDFNLQFGDTYQIVDGQGQLLIPERISPKCLAKEVEIKNGSFITQCSDGMAKWKVQEGQCAFVPLFLSAIGENFVNLNLTSRDKFRPVFHFGEQKVDLGMKNKAFVVSENGMSTLPPSSQIVVLLFDQNGDFISCTVKTDGHVFAKINLKREPGHVKVCSEENTDFLLTLPMKMTIDVDEDLARYTDYKFWIIFGGLVLTISAAVVCIFLYCHHKCQKNSQGNSSREPPQAAPESPYLEPRAIQRIESTESSMSPCSSSEHIYEEVDEMDFGQINENTKV